MSNSTKLFSTEWGGLSQGRNAKQSNGVDINGYIKGSLDDDAPATEQGDEQAEEERVEEEARANQS